MSKVLFEAIMYHEADGNHECCLDCGHAVQPSEVLSRFRILERTEVENGWQYLAETIESPIYAPGSIMTISHSDMVIELDLVRAEDAMPVPSLSDTTKTLREVILEAKAVGQTFFLKGSQASFVDLMEGVLFRVQGRVFDIFIPDFYLDQQAYLARDGWVLHDEGGGRTALRFQPAKQGN